MPVLHFTNFVEAPIEVVFGLSRSVSIYKIAFQKNKVWPVAGITFGLIREGEMITWEMKFLFKKRIFSIKVFEMKINSHFEEKIINNEFIDLRHEHFFKATKNGTIIIDRIDYRIKNGLLRNLINKFVVSFFEKNISRRIEVINQYALSDKWKALLNV